MPRSIKETTISIGFVQLPVSLFKATADATLDLRSLCECGQAPKQAIACESCGKTYTSWATVPNRGYKLPTGQYAIVSLEEVKNAKAGVKYDSFEVQKTVPFTHLATRYVLSDPLFLLPPEGTNNVAKKGYNVVTDALDAGNMALLAYLTLRDRTYRYAIVADRAENALLAYELKDRRPLPYEPDHVAVTEAEKKSLQGTLQGLWSEDPEIPAPKDGLVELIEERIKALGVIPGTESEQAVLTTK